MVALFTSDLLACPNCATSSEVWYQIQQQAPWLTLVTLTSAFLVVVLIIVFIARAMARARWLLGGALLTGATVGGLFDGTLFHQILQWHQMISSIVPPDDLVASKVNMFWDGMFHAYCWAGLVVGLGTLTAQLPNTPPHLAHRVVLGGGLAGWGVFNLVEGSINHHLIGLHHVHPGSDQLAWNLAFLAFGVLLVAVGGALFWPRLRHLDAISGR